MADRPIWLERRHLIAAAAIACFAPEMASGRARSRASTAPAVSLIYMCRHPLLRAFLESPPRRRVWPGGKAGFNYTGAHAPLIEEQANGAEWILHGIFAQKPGYIERGWQAFDYGQAWQEADGGFGRYGYYHSNSMYLEALTRALILDPSAVTPERLDCLRRGLRWMQQPANVVKGMQQNAPYAHRHYLIAAMFGQGAKLLGDANFAEEARRAARAGFATQRADGVNPELGGFDSNYQMAGVLCALRYYAAAPADMRKPLWAMISRAIAAGLRVQQPDGAFATDGSTRSGREVVAGNVKQPNYPDIVEALCYADRVVPTPAWRQAALAAARFNKMPLPAGLQDMAQAAR